MLQQHLPFTVLKPGEMSSPNTQEVATAPTVYGIETQEILLNCLT